MSPKHLLICTLALILGSKTLPISAQTADDPATTSTRRSLPGIVAGRSRTGADPDSVRIVLTTLGPNATSTSGGDNFLKLQGFDLRSLIAHVTGVSPVRVELPSSLDLTARYDVSLSLPRSTGEATMNAIILYALEDRFHLAATRLIRPADVYVVSASGAPPPSFRATAAPEGDGDTATDSTFTFRLVSNSGQAPDRARPGIQDLDGISMAAASLSAFCQALEGEVDRPVVNETHLKGAFNFNLQSSTDPNNDLMEQFKSKMNLLIQPSNRPIEFLVFSPSGSDSPQEAQALFVLRSHSKQTREAMDWDAWLAASCRIEPGSIPRQLCAKSGLPDRTQEPSGPAPRRSANRQSAP